MDNHLRKLKRQLLADPSDSQTQARYIAALERVVGGVDAADEHPHFSDAGIASCWIKTDDIDEGVEEELFENFDFLQGYTVSDTNGERMGFMFDIYWEDNYDPDDLEEMSVELSPAAHQLFTDAANQGYKMLVFWK